MSTDRDQYRRLQNNLKGMTEVGKAIQEAHKKISDKQDLELHRRRDTRWQLAPEAQAAAKEKHSKLKALGLKAVGLISLFGIPSGIIYYVSHEPQISQASREFGNLLDAFGPAICATPFVFGTFYVWYRIMLHRERNRSSDQSTPANNGNRS